MDALLFCLYTALPLAGVALFAAVLSSEYCYRANAQEAQDVKRIQEETRARKIEEKVRQREQSASEMERLLNQYSDSQEMIPAINRS